MKRLILIFALAVPIPASLLAEWDEGSGSGSAGCEVEQTICFDDAETTFTACLVDATDDFDQYICDTDYEDDWAQCDSLC